MASSNRHWPSMFKSKPCNPSHQLHHDMSNSSSSATCHRTPYTPGVGSDEKSSPEPKARWNPKPEQIRILEGIFNSGMVNPPRDEIRKIRIQLQEYGQVGDANVFYWFQNRKSRSKHKLRHLLNAKSHHNSPLQNPPPQFAATNNSSSSSNSSGKSSPTDKMSMMPLPPSSNVVPTSPTASVNQAYFQAHNEPTLLIPDPFFPPPPPPVYQSEQGGGGGVVAATTTHGYGLSAQPQNVGPCTDLLLSEIMSHGPSSKKYHDHQDKAIKIMHHQQQYPQFISFCQSPTPTATVVPSVTVPSPASQFQGVGGDAGGAPKSTVFINDVAFEVGVGPFNVREAFGDEAVLVQSSGHPVLTDDWGVTLHPLLHGASYYLV